MNCRPLYFATGFFGMLLGAQLVAAQGAGTHVYSPPDVLSDSNITVQVNGPDNKPLKQQAFVTLYQRSSTLPLGTVMTTVSSEAVLTGMPGYGLYTVTVTTAGFETASKDIEYSAASGRVHVDVTLVPIIDKDHAPPSAATLPPKGQEHLEKGLDAMKAGKVQDAIKEFLAAFNVAPKNVEVCYQLGAAYLKIKDLPQAQKYLEMATSMDPGNVQALVALGQSLDQQKDYEGAIAPLERAATLNGKEWLARWVLADAYLRTGKYEKALKSAQDAVALGNGAANKAELIEGQALAQLGRREDAIKALENFLRDMPGDPAAPNVRAFVEKLKSAAPGDSPKTATPE